MFSYFTEGLLASAPKTKESKAEESVQDMKVRARMFQNQCDRDKRKLQQVIFKNRAELERHAREGNKHSGMLALKSLKVAERNLQACERNRQMVDIMVLDLDNATASKAMGEMQQTAAMAYKSLNANFSEKQIRTFTMNLEKQRALFLQKRETIDETNDSLMEDILEDADESAGGGADGKLEEEYEEYMALAYDQQMMKDRLNMVGAEVPKHKSEFEKVLDSFYGESSDRKEEESKVK